VPRKKTTTLPPEAEVIRSAVRAELERRDTVARRKARERKLAREQRAHRAAASSLIVSAIRAELERRQMSVRRLAADMDLPYERVGAALRRGSMPTRTADLILTALDLAIVRAEPKPKRKDTQ
jgi:hypothetical protein